MKKYLLLITCTVFCSIQNFAQTNLGFENWIDMGTYFDPDGWITSNLFAATGGTPSCVKAEPHWGNHSIGISPTTFFGFPFPGFASQQFYYTKRPKSVSFYYKYDGLASDSSVFLISFSKGPTNDSTNPIGEATFSLNTANAWTFQQANIDWYDNSIPDSATILMLNASQDTLSKLLVDDIGISMFGLAVAQPQKPDFKIFVNSYNNLMVDAALVGNDSRIIITNMQGQVVLDQENFNSTIDLNNFSSGIYAYEIRSAYNTPVVGKFLR